MPGEFLPPPHKLEEVCEKLGLLDWSNLELNPEHVPGKKPKPNQLIADACDFHLKLESVMHAALVTSERGIGKTNTMLASLRISTQMRIDKRNIAPWSTDEDERAFKPTVYMCPSSVLDQTYQEIAGWWGGYFRIYVCYQTPDSCTNPARKSSTLGNLKDTQAIFDRLAKEHEDPMVRLLQVSFLEYTLII